MKLFKKGFLKDVFYIIELALVIVLASILFVMGARLSSLLIGHLTKFIGKRNPAHRVAYGNISRALPELSEAQRCQLLDKVWMNLGRVLGEFFHIATMRKSGIEKIVDTDSETDQVIEEMIAWQKSGKGGVVTSAHFGNWEVALRYFNDRGVKVKALYRPLSNPYVDWLVTRVRRGSNIAKGRDGNKEIIKEVKKGTFVVILADQKVTGGVPVKFFHKEAYTTESIAKIALKYDIKLIIAKAVRVESGFKFNFSAREIDKSEVAEKGEDKNIELTKIVTNKIEGWVRDCPEQWFWVHDRWKK